LISVSCQLVSSDSTILLKNVRVYKFYKGLWGTIKSFLTERFPNNPHGNLACAIILGDSRLIKQSEIISFQEAGVLHLFAVSGLHVGFMYILVRQVCSILFLKNIFCEILGILSAGIYVMVVGFPDSAIRAWLMLFLFLLFSMLQRKKNSMNSLLVSGLIILFIEGESLFSVGFQMSYTIVTGIVWVFKSNTTKGFNKSLFSYCLSIFKLTITCSFASSLLLIDYFNHFPAFSFITNFLLQPIIFLFFSISFFSIFIHINILSYILEYIQLYVFWICDYFANINANIVGVIALDLHNSIHLILFASFLFSYHLRLNLNHRFLIISSFYILTFFVFVILPI
jgi:competence protein ComEC